MSHLNFVKYQIVYWTLHIVRDTHDVSKDIFNLVLKTPAFITMIYIFSFYFKIRSENCLEPKTFRILGYANHQTTAVSTSLVTTNLRVGHDCQYNDNKSPE
jgi:hypothetical protein